MTVSQPGGQPGGQPGSRVGGQPGSQTDDENGDPGLARARTSLAWTRTALSFAAVGGVVLKSDLIPGLLIMAAAPAIWQLGRLAHHLPGRLRLVTATIVVVAALALAVAATH